MVDELRLLRLLDRLRQEIAHLRRLADYPVEQLLGDPDRVAAAKYYLVVSIEICIDVGEHIIASEGLPTPGTYGEVFATLGAGGYLPSDKIEDYRRMAGFRNLLVHDYADVDDSRVIEIIRNQLGDFDLFAQAVAAKLSGAAGS
jgi:uncharacterized protein YutE (UPF0331/DUF86 family)